MCGISGVYHYHRGEPVSGPMLRQMLAAIRHRGPDDEGMHIDQDLGIGMRRLSIIDLAGGQQPIYNEDGRLVIVFNGEIYNYRDLTQQLQGRGHVFTTASDTEVIVHLYEEYGEACVHHLRGMFAFAVWDQRHRRLFLARDRLGIKPLYYTQADGRLVFGSEIKAILQHPEAQARVNLQGLSHFLTLKYVPAPHTMFDGIMSLPPGHTLTCDQNGVTVRSYWDLSFTHDPRQLEDEHACAEQLDTLLRESVRLRMRSDVPFGAFLSGGIDSSLVVALMSDVLNEPVKTFSVGFDRVGKEGDELPYARLVAQQFQTDHHEIMIRPEDFADLAEKIAWHLDQPIADQATLATYMVAELASRHVKMVLTGEGGDELFAGYSRYAGERLSPLFRYMPSPAKSLALAMGSRFPGMRRAKIALYALCQSDEMTRFANWFPLFNTDMKAALLSDGLKGELNGASTHDVFAQCLAHVDTPHPLHRMLYADTKLWLPDFLLSRDDKMTMATSLEARVPLLDHKVVEFAASLPPHLKLRGLTRKYLLKQVSRKWIPASIIERKKQGFPLPIPEWFRGELRPFLRDILAPATMRRRSLFNVDYVGTLLDEHDAGFANHGYLLWGLASVELWHRQFIDAPSRCSHAAMEGF